MKLSLYSICLVLCGVSTSSAQDQVAFVTRLGNDTLAVEQFTQTETGVEATVIVRSPSTTIREFNLIWGPHGGIDQYEAVVREPGQEEPVRHEMVTVGADGNLIVKSERNGESQTRNIEADAMALPFIDMVHWPFELMLARAHAQEADSLVQPLFSGRRVWSFVIRRMGDGKMTVTHPFRGTMDVSVDEEGHLLMLDAGRTTRKLIVKRVDHLDMDMLARRYAARDAQGEGFGPLSSRGKTEVDLHGAQISVDYGQPSKRGREIFGKIVSFGKVWRTGANRATHFTTDKPLKLGSLEVPAGEYTLYSIPRPDGATLIVNTQTGQGGTTYHADRDLGRIEVGRVALDEPVEVFTIRIDEEGRGGMLRLQWDRTEWRVPIMF